MTEPCASRTTWLRKSGATAVAAALLLGSMPPGTAIAQTASAARFRGEPVTLNFVNAEIEGVARAMSAILRQQFVVDPRVRGTITLYSEEPLTPREAYFNFLAALRGLGFTVVEVNGLYKVVPEADAKLQTGTGRRRQRRPPRRPDPDPDLSPQPREREQPRARCSGR
jgi:general secretion pathway protein D